MLLIGAALEQLHGICRGDHEALDAIDTVTQNAVGTNQHVDNVNSLTDRPDGNSSAQAMRRLRKDRPGLHAEVLAGERSPSTLFPRRQAR